jgi:hypothetical protein
MHRERAFTRHLVSIGAKILSPDLATCVECVVKDISEGGALVALRGEASVPDRIYLWQARTGASFECEVRWRKLNLVGLKFIDADALELRALLSTCVAADRVAEPARLRGVV